MMDEAIEEQYDLISADTQTQEMQQSNEQLGLKNEQLISSIQQHHLQLETSQEKLQESEERFKLVMQATIEGIWDWNIQEDTLYFSTRWLEMLGFIEGEVEANFSSWMNLIHPDDRNLFNNALNEYINGHTKRFLVEYRLINKAHKYRWMEARGVIAKNSDGNPYRIVGSHMDITDRKTIEEELENQRNKLEETVKERTKELIQANQTLRELALIDGLTRIANRRHFDEKLEAEWRRSIRENSSIALILIDIDFFKPYNDTFGHPQGDQCLKQVASTLRNTIHRPSDLVARYGGEEFVALLPNSDLDGALIVAEKMREAVQDQKIKTANQQTSQWVSISIGVSQITPQQDIPAAHLLEAADEALYKAKEQGRNRVVSNTKSEIETDASSETIKLYGILTNYPEQFELALTHEEYKVYFQPVINTKTQQTASLEAYVRWDHPKYGAIPPRTFIPVAEQFQFIHKLDQWVFDMVLMSIKQWHKHNLKGCSVTLNPSLKTLTIPELANNLSNSLDLWKINPENIEIDIKAEFFDQTNKTLIHQIQQLKDIGFRIAIDGFTLSHSPILSIDKLPIDSIKLHHQFLFNHPEAEPQIIDFISEILDRRIRVVTEGIETKDLLDIAEYYHFYFLKGYYFSRPIPGSDIINYLKSNS